MKSLSKFLSKEEFGGSVLSTGADARSFVKDSAAAGCYALKASPGRLRRSRAGRRRGEGRGGGACAGRGGGGWRPAQNADAEHSARLPSVDTPSKHALATWDSLGLLRSFQYTMFCKNTSLPHIYSNQNVPDNRILEKNIYFFKLPYHTTRLLVRGLTDTNLHGPGVQRLDKGSENTEGVPTRNDFRNGSNLPLLGTQKTS